MVYFDPYSRAIAADPFPVYRALRDEAPAYRNDQFGFWCLSRYEDCMRAARDFKTFSNVGGLTLEPLRNHEATLQLSDPPVHTHLRRQVSFRFTPDKVLAMEDGVRTMARELLAPLVEAGSFDFVADFAARLPMAIICQMLGFARDDEDLLRRWSDDALIREEGLFDVPDAAVQAILAMHGYFNRFMDERRSAGNLGRRGDLVDLMMQAEERGDLSHAEVIGYLTTLTIAGNETTTKLLANTVYQLWRHPQQKTLLLADRALLAGSIEETLRFDTPVHLQARRVARDVELHGRTLREGDKVGLLYLSANRDERKFAAADRYEIKRNPRDHMGFGYGLHACLGSALARLEVRVALEELLDLAADWDIDEAGIVRTHSSTVRGIGNLPISVTRH